MDDIRKQQATMESEIKTLFLNQKKSDERTEILENQFHEMKTRQEVAYKEIPYWIKEAVAEGNKLSQKFFMEELTEMKQKTNALENKIIELENKPSKIIAHNVFKYIGLAIGVILTMFVTFVLNNIFS